MFKMFIYVVKDSPIQNGHYLKNLKTDTNLGKLKLVM